MQFQTMLEADIPRVTCGDHGVVQLPVPWAEPGSRFTAMFEALVIDWLKVAPANAVAGYLRLSWNATDGIMQRAVKRGLARRQATPVTDISVDETSFQRRHEYVTVVTDQASGAVIHLADNRTMESLDSYFQGLSSEECSAIESVSMDMWPAYIGVVRRYVPDADRRICFDKFHVAKYFGDAVDRVRRAEHRRLTADGDNRLKKTRYRWLENPNSMSVKNWESFQNLRHSALQTARAWAIKEHAMCLWHYTSRTWALKQWSALLSWAMHSLDGCISQCREGLKFRKN
jgi:transposase